MTARRILAGHGLPYMVNGKSVSVGMCGIQFAPDGALLRAFDSRDLGDNVCSISVLDDYSAGGGGLRPKAEEVHAVAATRDF
ncbi:MAG: hypothetical protein LBS75_00090 [Synergistaceae bacterium]|jgi:hypothetical protein|nr:hypothetical protein [Synergistaceae bacterium]